MMFDKVKYWKNRKDGKRGQGELPKPEITEGKSGEHLIRIGTSLQLVNRKTARMYSSGTKKDKPVEKHYDPNVPNKIRVKNQRIASGRVKV